jgi:sugar O-acyltransferase (sialic acid O-acetyltransferase NeuD family)
MRETVTALSSCLGLIYPWTRDRPGKITEAGTERLGNRRALRMLKTRGINRVPLLCSRGTGRVSAGTEDSRRGRHAGSRPCVRPARQHDTKPALRGALSRETAVSGPGSRSAGERCLILFGAGGFGRETAQALFALAYGPAPWRLLGYLDDDPAKHGTVIEDVPVIGGRDEIRRRPQASVVVCTARPGDFASRVRIVAELDLPAERYATIVHPSATVSDSSSIGHGSVLLAYVALTAAVIVGAHVAIMPHVTLTHDNVIEDFATIASGTRLGGGVRVGRSAYIGAGAVIGEHLTVGEFSLVGMGSVVTRDVPAGEVWFGSPARRVERRFPALPPSRVHQAAAPSSDVSSGAVLGG